MSAESGPVFRKHPKKGRFFVGRKEKSDPKQRQGNIRYGNLEKRKSNAVF